MRSPNTCRILFRFAFFVTTYPTPRAAAPPTKVPVASSPSEDYLAVLAGQRQWIVTTNFAGCPGQPQIALRIAPCSLPWQSS